MRHVQLILRERAKAEQQRAIAQAIIDRCERELKQNAQDIAALCSTS